MTDGRQFHPRSRLSTSKSLYQRFARLIRCGSYFSTGTRRRSLSVKFNGNETWTEVLLPTGYGTLSGKFTILAKAGQRGLSRRGLAIGQST